MGGSKKTPTMLYIQLPLTDGDMSDSEPTFELDICETLKTEIEMVMIDGKANGEDAQNLIAIKNALMCIVNMIDNATVEAS